MHLIQNLFGRFVREVRAGTECGGCGNGDGLFVLVDGTIHVLC